MDRTAPVIAMLMAAVMLAPFALMTTDAVSAQEAGAGETWTLMVYMSGDSSLSGQISSDLQEMKRVGSGEGLNIIVLHDSSGVGDTGLGRVLPGRMEEIPLGSVNASWGNELNLGKPDILSQFVTWAAEEYPADRYMLDLWGHGNGWPGICPDKGDFLEMAELRQAMTDIHGSGLRMDMVSMDACQMGMMEVAYELRGKAGYALLSQKDVPLNGWPYDIFLGHLKAGGSPAEIGTAMIDSYITWGMGGNSLYSLTLSLTDLDRMEELAEALDDYSAEAARMAGFFNPEFIAARAQTEKYDGNAQYDLVHLLDNIDEQTECRSLAALADTVRDAMAASIVHENSWTNILDEPAENANGLSIWFPGHAPTADYLGTGFGSENSWTGFLSAMAGYFQNPGREDEPLPATASGLDSDGDGLADSISIHHGGQDAGVLTVAEIYGPDGSLFRRETMGAVPETSLDIPLGSLGFYQAALYQYDGNGKLLNYTLVKGLAMEGLSLITGRVTSNAGRGLAWVEVSLMDPRGNVVASVFTDNSGYYEMEVVIPSDTDGIGLLLVCGLGGGRQSVSMGALETQSVMNFRMDVSSAYIPWAVRAIGALNLAGIMALVYWAAWGREKKRKNTTENVIDSPPISPQ